MTSAIDLRGGGPGIELSEINNRRKCWMRSIDLYFLLTQSNLVLANSSRD